MNKTAAGVGSSGQVGVTFSALALQPHVAQLQPLTAQPAADAQVTLWHKPALSFVTAGHLQYDIVHIIQQAHLMRQPWYHEKQHCFYHSSGAAALILSFSTGGRP